MCCNNFCVKINRIVPILDEDYPSSKSDSSDQDDDEGKIINSNNHHQLLDEPQQPTTNIKVCNNSCLMDELNAQTGGGVGGISGGGIIGVPTTLNLTPTSLQQIQTHHNLHHTNTNTNNINSALDKLPGYFPNSGNIERKRRKLPEIPKIKKGTRRLFTDK